MWRATTIQEAEESPWPASMTMRGLFLVWVGEELVMELGDEDEVGDEVGGGPEMER